jgi:hypothetical protein
MTAGRVSLWCVGVAALTVITGCAYYNAMWSAEQYAKGARKLDAKGQESEARAQWARAAAKAEAVAVKHPHSRWVDDALVLQAEGLARSGSCGDAGDAIARARAVAKDVALRERIDLADVQCALAANNPIQAEAVLTGALGSKDQSRRSRAEYLAGEAAAMRLDYATAIEHLRRSHELAARPARANVLLALGDATAAAAVIDTIGGDPTFVAERADLLAQLAVVGGPEMASATLDRLLTHTRIPFAEQGHLLIADGDRRLAQGDYPAAQTRYNRAIVVAGLASVEAATAHVRLQRLAVVRATQLSDLTPVMEELRIMTRGEGGNAEAKQLLDMVTRAVATHPSAGARFRIAEIARDSLGATALAGQLFLAVAASDTASLYAPKALVAALPLLPDRHDSIAAVLDTRYPNSPYTHAYHGEASIAYAAAEDSLARELGVEVARTAAVRPSGLRFGAPVPGIRGPRLDEPAPQPSAVRPARASTQPRPGARPNSGNTPVDRPVVPDRP